MYPELAPESLSGIPRSSYTTLAEGQVGWSLYRIWYETERIHESLDYQTPHQRLTINV